MYLVCVSQAVAPTHGHSHSFDLDTTTTQPLPGRLDDKEMASNVKVKLHLQNKY